MSGKSLASVSVESHVKELNDALKKLAKSMIYVGIAKGSKGDTRDDGAPPNSDLGFIHEFGSPAANIPPRPFLVPGINDAKDEIKDGLRSAMKAALADDEKAMTEHMERTGFRAVTAVKKYMQTAKFAPLKPSTIRSRNRSRQTKGKRENEQQGEGIRPLINTGALHDAIDFTVEK